MQNQITPALFTKSGNLGDKWIKAEIDVKSTKSFQLAFVGTTGRGIRGDIAIDDITLNMGYVSYLHLLKLPCMVSNNTSMVIVIFNSIVGSLYRYVALWLTL